MLPTRSEAYARHCRSIGTRRSTTPSVGLTAVIRFNSMRRPTTASYRNRPSWVSQLSHYSETTTVVTNEQVRGCWLTSLTAINASVYKEKSPQYCHMVTNATVTKSAVDTMNMKYCQHLNHSTEGHFFSN